MACPKRNLGGRQYYCTVELALQVLGGKWKPIILWHLGCDGTLRFSELKRIMPNITQKMLTQQLRELETDDMVSRKVYPQVPPKVEYSLTELGRSVMPVLESLGAWGKQFEDIHRQEKHLALQTETNSPSTESVIQPTSIPNVV
ncbi:winged helix-turn-helix transcriptional regulator [Desulfovibrio inopinatus]|uniref:winged helix-turn-helix transcriptional regulator n=1 Tax=Desulfovibrio inopinatus TaxID=102109 RepID=UPI0003F7E32A|nr:helix-turn-helix domain-containing protein [Desulfovibrio inopinatus]